MKKFINIMLALALTIGVATITVAQDTSKTTTTTKKTTKKAGKKGTTTSTTSSTTSTVKAKAKGKKAKDADDEVSVSILFRNQPRAGSLLEGRPPRLSFFDPELVGLPIANVMAWRR